MEQMGEPMFCYNKTDDPAGINNSLLVMETESRSVRLDSVDLINAIIGMDAGRRNLIWVEFECMSGTLWATRGDLAREHGGTGNSTLTRNQ